LSTPKGAHSAILWAEICLKRGLEFQNKQGKFCMMNLATCLLSQSLPSVQLSQRH